LDCDVEGLRAKAAGQEGHNEQQRNYRHAFVKL